MKFEELIGKPIVIKTNGRKDLIEWFHKLCQERGITQNSNVGEFLDSKFLFLDYGWLQHGYYNWDGFETINIEDIDEFKPSHKRSILSDEILFRVIATDQFKNLVFGEIVSYDWLKSTFSDTLSNWNGEVVDLNDKMFNKHGYIFEKVCNEISVLSDEKEKYIRIGDVLNELERYPEKKFRCDSFKNGDYFTAMIENSFIGDIEFKRFNRHNIEITKESDAYTRLSLNWYEIPNVTELTMQEIADKFGVPVENLKILK